MCKWGIFNRSRADICDQEKQTRGETIVRKLKITSMIERGFRPRPADVGLTWCRRVVHSAFNKFENVDVRASQLGRYATPLPGCII